MRPSIAALVGEVVGEHLPVATRATMEVELFG